MFSSPEKTARAAIRRSATARALLLILLLTAAGNSLACPAATPSAPHDPAEAAGAVAEQHGEDCQNRTESDAQGCDIDRCCPGDSGKVPTHPPLAMVPPEAVLTSPLLPTPPDPVAMVELRPPRRC